MTFSFVIFAVGLILLQWADKTGKFSSCFWKLLLLLKTSRVAIRPLNLLHKSQILMEEISEFNCSVIHDMSCVWTVDMTTLCLASHCFYYYWTLSRGLGKGLFHCSYCSGQFFPKISLMKAGFLSYLLFKFFFYY